MRQPIPHSIVGVGRCVVERIGHGRQVAVAVVRVGRDVVQRVGMLREIAVGVVHQRGDVAIGVGDRRGQMVGVVGDLQRVAQWILTAQKIAAAVIGKVPLPCAAVDHLVQIADAVKEVGGHFPNRVDARYYTVGYDIGYSTGSLLRVHWVNDQGQLYTVFQDGAHTPTGYRERYFAIHETLGASGHFVVQVAGGDKLYSIADNIARQHLNEPFSYKVGIQIDTATGAFGYRTQDLRVAGATPLGFVRYYNGHSDRLGVMGYGWSHSYETRLAVTAAEDAGVIFGAGNEIFFTWNSNTQSFAPADARVHDELVKNGDGSYTFTTKAKQRYNFNTAGVLQSIQDPNNITVAVVGVGRCRIQRISHSGQTSVAVIRQCDRGAALCDDGG